MTAASARASTGIIDPMARPFSSPDGEAQRLLLREGRIKARGLMPECSNYTYLAEVCDSHGAQTLGVYKPAAGQVSLPRPMTARVGGEPVRDTALLDWCAELLRGVLGEPARV